MIHFLGIHKRENLHSESVKQFVRPGLHAATGHATRQRFHSSAREGAASKPAAHVTSRNEQARQSAIS